SHPVLVPAHVGDDEAILGNGLTELGKDSFGAHRVLVRAPLMIPVRCEGLAAAGDLFPETTAIAVDRALRRRRERAERQFRVRDDTELSRIVAADLRLVGVNVNQARWRNREGEARIP